MISNVDAVFETPDKSPVFMGTSSFRMLLYRLGKFLGDRISSSALEEFVTRFMSLEKLIKPGEYIQFPYLDGDPIWVCPHYSMHEYVIRNGVYEPGTIKLIQFLVESGFSFVDIGANIGLHSIAAGRCVTRSTQKIVAFEPEPSARIVFEANRCLNLLDFIRIEPYALGNWTGMTTLYVSSTNNQGLHSLFAGLVGARPTICMIARLDDLYSSMFTAQDDCILLKIDVEGYEADVLAGASLCLSSIANLAIIYEIAPSLLLRTGRNFVEINDCLNRIGCDQRFLIDESTFAVLPTNNGYATSQSKTNHLAIKGVKVRELMAEYHGKR